jgi:hypothetical protein
MLIIFTSKTDPVEDLSRLRPLNHICEVANTLITQASELVQSQQFFLSDYSVQVAINVVQTAPGKGEATVFTGQQTVA